MKKLLLTFALLASTGFSQTIQTPSRLTFRTTDPTNPCNNSAPLTWVPPTSSLWGCVANSWLQLNTPSVPTGSIIMITSGTCPANYSEVTALDGVTVIGTLSSHMDVGGTGGNNNLTPSGTNSTPLFTGTGGQSTSSNTAGTPAGTVGAITMSGSTAAEASHTHSVTAAGTNGTGTVTPLGTIAWPAGVPTNASGAFTQGAISWPAGVPTNSAISMSGSTAGEAAHTHSVTAAGTNSAPTFTGNALSSHTHDYTQVPNHVHVQSVNSAATGGLSGYTADTSTNTSVASGYSTANPTGGVATGTTIGPSITLTPAGTNSAPTFTGSGVTSGAGSSHLHTFGTLAASTPTVSWPAGVPTIAAGSFTQPTISWPAGVPTLSGSSSTTSAQTFTGSPVTSGAGSSHLHTFGTLAASTPTFTGDALGTHNHTLTATGTVSAPTFTGNAADNRSAYMKVIFCSKD